MLYNASMQSTLRLVLKIYIMLSGNTMTGVLDNSKLQVRRDALQTRMDYVNFLDNSLEFYTILAYLISFKHRLGLS